MAFRSTQIVLHNRTDQDLTLTSMELLGGIWTEGMEVPDNIGGQAGNSWESESDGIGTGTEGSVVFAIGGEGANLRIYWDNPALGNNKYAIDVSPGFALYQDGWSGDNVTAEFTLEPSTLHAASFRPSVNGFPYSNNDWQDAPLTYLDLGVAMIPIGNASQGLCGGMVYAALDYWGNSLPTPQEKPSPAAPGTPLYDFFVSRLRDSFDLPSLPVELYKIMSPLYPDTGSAGNPLEGRAPIIIKDAWPQVRSWIDGGVPAPICLQNIISANPLDLGENHQTAAWGYQMNGNLVTLYTYDPNIPSDDSVSITFDASSVLNPPSVTVSNAGQHPVYCFMPTAYERQVPPDVAPAVVNLADAQSRADALTDR